MIFFWSNNTKQCQSRQESVSCCIDHTTSKECALVLPNTPHAVLYVVFMVISQNVSIILVLKWSYAIVYDHRSFKLYVPHRGAKKQQQFIQYWNRIMSDHIEMLRPPYQYLGNDTFQIAYTHICSLQLIISNREGCHQAYRHSHTSTCSFPFAFSVFDLIYWPYTSIHKPLNLISIYIPCPCLVWGLLKSNMVLK